MKLWTISHQVALAAFLAIIVLEPGAESQSQSSLNSIALGKVVLHLQENESYVIRILSAEFDLKGHATVGPNSSWQVCEKNTSGATPCLGSVAFDNGRLMEATRRWPQDGSSASLVQSLHVIAERLVSEGHRSCRLDTVKIRDRFSVDDSTLIICGKKQIRIGFITPDPQAHPYILEVLQDSSQ